jgi:hypothetical protein
MEALRRKMEKRLDDNEARMVRTRQLLADSTALLQQSKSSRYHRLPAKPRAVLDCVDGNMTLCFGV